MADNCNCDDSINNLSCHSTELEKSIDNELDSSTMLAGTLVKMPIFTPDLPQNHSKPILNDGNEICGTIERHVESCPSQFQVDFKNAHLNKPSIEKKCTANESNENLDEIYSESEVNYENLLVQDSLNNESVNSNKLYRKARSSNHVVDLVTSWNGTDNTRYKQRRNRSQSWCANRPSDDGFGAADIRLLRDRLVRTQHRVQPAVIKNFSRSQRLTLASLALVDFMSFCSMSIMAPFFPKESADKGMSDTISGFVFSFYAFIMFLSSPVFGKVLPVVGAKFLFISGMFIAGACNIMFGTLQYLTDYTMFTVYCFLIRGLEALGASAFSTASYVFVVNHFPNNIGSVFGILETFVGLGMSVGPAIGGLLYSVGGFGLPFYVLGVAMVVTIPLNCCLLASDGDYTMGTKTGSILDLLKVPSVVITGLVIVVVSNTWAFLDPTLEPHLRQFNLSPEQIGLIFLLFSALYGLFSPIWGWLADRVSNHWCMMFWGLILCTVGLLLLGPSPIIPGLQNSVWLNLVALSILGISVALTLLPTFQGVLTSSIEEGGCAAVLSTYSVVAGVWSCCYSLGEVIGPALGGALTQRAGFPLTTTIMAAMCFFMALITVTFFTLKENSKLENASDTMSDLNTASDSLKSVSLLGNESRITFEDDNTSVAETRPLLLSKNKEKALGYESFAKEISRKLESKTSSPYIMGSSISKDNRALITETASSSLSVIGQQPTYNAMCYAVDSHFKKGRSGLYPVVEGKPAYARMVSRSESNSRRGSMEVIKHNFDKIKYYEQSRREDYDRSTFDSHQVTDIRGTVNLTSSGACEV